MPIFKANLQNGGQLDADILYYTRTSVAPRRHLVLVGILAEKRHLNKCYSQTEYLQ